MIGSRFVYMLVVWAAASATLLSPAIATAAKAKGNARLEEMSLDRWAKLREAELYQLKIAEKLYLEKNYTAAAAEYEKFITLYESSEGAPFAQLKWALCQAHLKKLNTAIKDGYQTVIDYWPDSPEAVASALLIARTYRTIGDIEPAKVAYAKVVSDYPDEMVATFARLELAEIARIEGDTDRRIALLKDLVHNAARTGDVARACANASETLAELYFYQGDFAAGKESLATTYNEPHLVSHVVQVIRAPIGYLVSKPETKDKGLKLADSTIAYLGKSAPDKIATDEDKARLRESTYRVAAVQSSAQRQDEAKKAYEAALKQLGSDDDLLGHYGDWLMNQGNYDEARSTFRRLSDPLAAEGRVALSYRTQHKPLEAVPLIEALIARDSEHTKGWQWHLAECYREGGKYREAVAAYQQCEPSQDKYERLGMCQRSIKEFDEAIITYREWMATNKNSEPAAWLQIAFTQEQAGHQEDAIKTFHKVCKNYPKSNQASQAHAHLQNKYNISVTLGGSKVE